MVARRKAVSLSSWPGASRPSTPRRRSADGRDTPGHDGKATGRGHFPPSRCRHRRLANYHDEVEMTGPRFRTNMAFLQGLPQEKYFVGNINYS